MCYFFRWTVIVSIELDRQWDAFFFVDIDFVQKKYAWHMEIETKLIQFICINSPRLFILIHLIELCSACLNKDSHSYLTGILGELGYPEKSPHKPRENMGTPKLLPCSALLCFCFCFNTSGSVGCVPSAAHLCLVMHSTVFAFKDFDFCFSLLNYLTLIAVFVQMPFFRPHALTCHFCLDRCCFFVNSFLIQAILD